MARSRASSTTADDSVDPATSSAPILDQLARLSTQIEREAMAKKKGLCVTCGIKTHDVKKMFKRVPLTNAQVYEGKCIKDNRDLVPPEVYLDWKKAFAPPPTAALEAAKPKAEITISPPKQRRARSKGPRVPRPTTVLDIVTNGATTESTATEVAHHGITCSFCEEADFKGPRFHCLDCPLNWCKSCENKGVHDEMEQAGHGALKMMEPSKESKELAESRAELSAAMLGVEKSVGENDWNYDICSVCIIQ